MVLPESGDADVWVDLRPHDALMLVPPVLVLGIGCRRGTEKETLDRRFAAFCAETGVLSEAICAAASIDLKRDEKGLADFCAAHGWPLYFDSAEALAALEGDFSASGKLIIKKHAAEGVTFALAQKKLRLDWRITHG